MIMTMSNKAVQAMIKEAVSRSELAAAMKSGAGKDLVSQIKALEIRSLRAVSTL